MRSPLACNQCDEQCGWIYQSPWNAYGQDPPEVTPWHEELVDDEGNCYCSSDCLTKATQEDGEEIEQDA